MNYLIVLLYAYLVKLGVDPQTAWDTLMKMFS